MAQWHQYDVERKTSDFADIAGVSTVEKAGGDWKFRVDMLFQRGMTSTLT